MNHSYRHALPLLGAIAGDIIGSVYEADNIKTTDFPLFHTEADFTDDTVLSLAVADCLLQQGEFAHTLWSYGRAYPHRGYGGHFQEWLNSPFPQPYGSYGNGSAMRVSAVGLTGTTAEQVLELAKQTAAVSHNHPEGIKGAQAIALAIFLARKGNDKEAISKSLSQQFNYDLNFSLDQIRPDYSFDVSCQGSVPQAIVAFLESSDYENAIRLAISIGGDSDTIACMTGGIAAAYYQYIPEEIIIFVKRKLPDELLQVIEQFNQQ